MIGGAMFGRRKAERVARARREESIERALVEIGEDLGRLVSERRMTLNLRTGELARLVDEDARKHRRRK